MSKRGMSEEDRALEAMKRRRAKSDPGSSIPEDYYAEDTKPVNLIQSHRTKYDTDKHFRDDMDVLQERYENDPAFRAFWRVWRQSRHESKDSLDKVADSALEVHAQVPDLKQRLDNIEFWKKDVDVLMKYTKRILGVVAASVLGIVVTIVTKVYAFGVSTGEMEMRIRNLERSQPSYTRMWEPNKVEQPK